MKGLNKIALATAVAAAPFATQAMEPMNDSQMGDVTGQAGVTIELETQVDIGQIEYDQGTNSSFVMQDMSIGGVFEDSLGITMDIDLVEDGDTRAKPFVDLARGAQGSAPRALSDGDALISLGSRSDGSGGGDAAPADVSFSIDEMGLSTGNFDPTAEDDANTDPTVAGDPTNQDLGSDGDSALLMSNLSMDVFISQLDIIASNNEVAAFNSQRAENTGSLAIDVAFTLDNVGVDFDVAAAGISGMRMAGAGSLAVLKDDATGSAEMAGLALANPATVSLDIGAGETLPGHDIARPGGAAGDVLRVSLDHFQGDMYIDDISVGGGSVGSVAMSNLRVTDTDMAIYGRD